MKSVQEISGSVQFRLTSADVSGSLQKLLDSGITILDAEIESELSALVSVSSKDYEKAFAVLKQAGVKCELMKQSGFVLLLCQISKRWVLLCGCVILLILTVFLPTRILFLRVEGNENIAENYILDQLKESGLYFGCKRASIRSENIKNRLLADIPELEWVGVTTSGCVATVHISESEILSSENSKQSFGNVVAVCDGVIHSVTATKGNPLCKPGQAVQRGQVLISGYEDCGFVLKHTGAQGEVYANTFRVIEGIGLSKGDERTELVAVSRDYSIRIGKKLIKFSKDSGISHTGCVKMYLERYATLPGGFHLPFSLITETYYDYNSKGYCSTEEDFTWLSDGALSYVSSQMLGGTVLTDKLKFDLTEDACYFWGAYSCTEQIGINHIEEIHSYGENS